MNNHVHIFIKGSNICYRCGDLSLKITYSGLPAKIVKKLKHDQHNPLQASMEDIVSKKYRKKPVVIEAMLYKGVESIPEAEKFVGDSFKVGTSSYDGKKYTMAIVYIETLEGDMHVSKGDYIIKGVKGEFYPCKPDIFKETYEAVS